MASIILTKDHEIYCTREFIYQKNNLQDELRINKYSILIEWMNSDFCQIEEQLFNIIDNDKNYKLLYDRIKYNINNDGFLSNKWSHAGHFCRLLGDSLDKIVCLSKESISIITYFICSFFFNSDSKIKKYFSENNNLQNIVKQSFTELKRTINFIKLYYDQYGGIFNYNEFKFILEHCFNMDSELPASKIIMQAFFQDEEIDEFLKTYKKYHKNIDFYYKKMLESGTSENTIKYKIIQSCYVNKHSKNIPKNKTIYDLELTDQEMIEYFQLIYSYQYVLKNHKFHHFSTYQKYFEIIIFDFINNNQKLKKCPNCNKFFIAHKGRKGNNQKYCINCKNKSENSTYKNMESEIIEDARTFNDKYSKKFNENLKKGFSELENFESFTDCLSYNILSKIRKNALYIAHKIDNCNDANERRELEKIYREWKDKNDKLYTKKYIYHQYEMSKLKDCTKSQKFELQYYFLKKDLTIELKTISIDCYDTDDKKTVEYKVLEEL